MKVYTPVLLGLQAALVILLGISRLETRIQR
jgi:hypothetical protein